MSAPTFTDRNGAAIAHDGRASIVWRPSIYVVAVRDGALLLTRTSWSKRLMLPGGEADVAEALTNGAIRECHEETGYVFEPDLGGPIFVGERFFFHEGYRHALVFGLRGRIVGAGDPAWALPADEIAEVVWAPLASLSREHLHPLSWDVLSAVGLLPRPGQTGAFS